MSVFRRGQEDRPLLKILLEAGSWKWGAFMETGLLGAWRQASWEREG